MILSTFFRQNALLLLACVFALSCSTLVLAQNEETRQKAAITNFEAGQNAHERGDLTAAIEYYQKALQLNPEFPEAEFQRGAAAQELGRLADAEKAFRRAAELRPDWALPFAQLGAVLIAVNKLDEAKTFLQKAIELDANNEAARVILIEAYLLAQTPAPVLRSLLAETAKATDGKSNASAKLWTARATLERVLGDLTAAKVSLERALAIEPKNVAGRLERAEQFLLAKNFTAAAEDVKFALTEQPNNLSAQLALARIYAESDKAEESLRVLDSLDAEQKKLPPVIELRNLILASGATGAESISPLEKSLASDPSNVAVLGKLCLLTRRVNPQKALEYCRRANQIEPTNAAHAIGFGAALVQARRFDEAIAVLNQILKVDPNNYAARANLATALYEAKRYVESIVEFNRLLEVKPNTAVTYFFLATAHDALANYPEAMAAYQRFLELADPQQNQLEIDKTNLRVPSLKRQIEKGAGKKKPRT